MMVPLVSHGDESVTGTAISTIIFYKLLHFGHTVMRPDSYSICMTIYFFFYF